MQNGALYSMALNVPIVAIIYVTLLTTAVGFALGLPISRKTETRSPHAKWWPHILATCIGLWWLTGWLDCRELFAEALIAAWTTCLLSRLFRLYWSPLGVAVVFIFLAICTELLIGARLRAAKHAPRRFVNPAVAPVVPDEGNR